MFKNRFLSTASFLLDPRREGSGGNADPADDRIPEPELDDDETVLDPASETDPDPDADPDADPDDDEDDPNADPQDPPAGTQQSRGDRQMGELRRQARETARQNAELTRQIAEMRGEMAGLRAPAQAMETPAQRAERLALLSPEERIQETVNEALRAHDQRAQVLQNQLLDQADRSAFEARASANPLFKKLQPEIERRLADLRAKGQNLPREVVATYVIGERVIAQQGKKPQGAGSSRRQRETARPVRSGSDTGGNRQQRRAAAGTVEDMESRFGDVPI